MASTKGKRISYKKWLLRVAGMERHHEEIMRQERRGPTANPPPRDTALGELIHACFMQAHAAEGQQFLIKAPSSADPDRYAVYTDALRRFASDRWEITESGEPGDLCWIFQRVPPPSVIITYDQVAS